MTLRPIITLPDEKTLRQVSKPVASVDADTRKLWDDMLETMYDAPGIGLAATQVNVHAYPEKRGDGKGVTLCAEVLRRYGLMPAGFRVIFETDRFENNLYINPPYFCSDPYINNVLNAVSFEEGR